MSLVELEGLEEVEEGGGQLLAAPPFAPHFVTTEAQLNELVAAYSTADGFAMDVETRGVDRLNPQLNEVFWISLATTGRADAIPMGHPHGRMLRRSRKVKVLPPREERKTLKNGELSKAKVNRVMPDEFASPPVQLRPSVVFEALRDLFWSDQLKGGQNFKFDVKSVAKYYRGETMPGPFAETMVIAKLLDDRRTQNDLASLAREFLGITEYPKLGKAGVENFSIYAGARYACQDAAYTWTIIDRGLVRIEQQGLTNVFLMEMDLFEALLRMETTGALIDDHSLQVLRRELTAKIEELEAKIFVFNGGRAFNLRSNPEKIRFLFSPKREGGRGLKPLSHTKSEQPQVNEATLQHYADRDPAVALMVEHAEVSKLSGTYAESWNNQMLEGRLHPDFVQYGARTGRLSCRNPNLQNVPRADSPLGKRVRDLVIAPEGRRLVVADYDQIELRVLAHYSQDPTMVETFESGADIHAATAELLLGLERGSLKKGDPRRQLGKTINFAVSFGAGPGKIAATCAASGFPLGKTVREAVDEAQYFLDEFDRRFKAVADLKDYIIWKAKQRKPPYVRTILGRQRKLPELWWDDWKLRSAAERQAVNTVIQGSAADIMKLAMIEVDRLLLDRPADIVITVHDELVIEADEGFVDECKELVVGAMSGITLRGEPILSVPLDVACDSALRWSEAK